MAKLPKGLEISDRFRIHADSPIEDVGNLLRALTIMGFQNIGFELISDVHSYKGNGGKRHEINGLEFAKDWIAMHDEVFDVADLANHFKDNGRSTATAYAAVKTMIEKGELIKLSPKRYRRGGTKALPPPKVPEMAEAEPVRASRRGRHGMKQYTPSNRDLILTFIAPLDEFTVKSVGALMEQNGRPAKSASPMMAKFVDDKLINGLGDGKYRVLAKAKKEAAKLAGGETIKQAEAGE